MWRDIKNYEGRYQVNENGEVRSLNYNRSGKVQVLKQRENTDGYCQVKLYKNGIKKLYYVHRLVADAFIPNPDNLPQVNHKDENPRNNRLFNLEWCTNEYNLNYGTRNQRSSSSRSKSVKQYSLDGIFIDEYPSTHEVNRKLGFNQGLISAVCIGKYNQAYGYRWSYN